MSQQITRVHTVLGFALSFIYLLGQHVERLSYNAIV